MHFDGPNGTPAFTNEYPNSAQAVLRLPNTAGSTATIVKQFGLSSIYLKRDQLLLSSDITLNGDYTIECWVYIETFSSSSLMSIVANKTSNPTVMPLKINPIKSNYRTGWTLPGNSSTNKSTGMLFGKWNHIAAVRKDNKYMLFENGINVCEAIGTITPVIINTLFGWYISSPDNSVNGFVDEFRLLDGKAEYSANFTPPATPFTI